jgi:hypothetical protein
MANAQGIRLSMKALILIAIVLIGSSVSLRTVDASTEQQIIFTGNPVDMTGFYSAKAETGHEPSSNARVDVRHHTHGMVTDHVDCEIHCNACLLDTTDINDQFHPDSISRLTTSGTGLTAYPALKPPRN